MVLSAVLTKVSPIGLTYDDHEFRAVQLVRTRNGDRVHASAVFPRESVDGGSSMVSPDELRWAGELLARRGFLGSEVAILPSAAWCSSHIFELPPVEDIKARSQIARVEVAREKKCTPGDFELALWDLPAKGRQQESMVVSCNRGLLNSTLDNIEEAGFVPLGVDLPEKVLSRVLMQTQQETSILGVLHIGWGESLAVIKNQGAVVYVRRIDQGLKSIQDRIREQYKLSWRDASRILERMQNDTLSESERAVRGMWTSFVRGVVDELDIAIRYVSHAYRAADLGSIAVGGYGAAHPELHKEIDEVLGMPVRPLICPAMIESGMSESETARLALPYGLAARWDKL